VGLKVKGKIDDAVVLLRIADMPRDGRYLAVRVEDSVSGPRLGDREVAVAPLVYPGQEMFDQPGVGVGGNVPLVLAVILFPLEECGAMIVPTSHNPIPDGRRQGASQTPQALS
jgi:hypothetical protein